MNYKERQKEIQKSYFGESKLGGKYRNKHYDHFLIEEENNFICHEVYIDAKKYFEENGIQWWNGKKPTSNTLSSQIACINHLFPIRKDKKAVLALIQSIDPGFVDVEILNNDKVNAGYISFEVVSKIDHLNEGRGKKNELSRGCQCTSVDAVILAKKKGKMILVTFEWKYTELYYNEDKSKNPKDKNSGETRLNRYCELITHSDQLLSCIDGYKGTDYFFEPFYQLMRQTLWAEQMVKFKDDEVIKADDYITVHVIPKGNDRLREKEYKCSGKNLLDTWRERLVDPNKYVLLSPEELFNGLSQGKWHDLYKELGKRYWQDL